MLGWLAKALIVLGCVGYQWLVHSAVADGQAEPVRLALVWLPLALLAWWALTRPVHRTLWLFVLLAATLSTFLLQHQARLGLAAAYGIPHAAIYLSLLWFFGSTLLAGREPLITRLARRVHGGLDPVMERYTRRVTLSWCVFFAAQIVTSALLFRFATLNVWSLFVNVLNFPLLVLMFVAEYGYRVLSYPNHPQVTIMKAIRAFTDDASLSKSG
ncbi:MAG: hypothetical protein ACRDRT_13890 [Pseudonocardiaceae bacterium]